MSVKIECLLECENHLGEGPVWDVEEGRLYWVDGTGRRVDKPAVWRMDPKTGKVENWRVDKDVGAMALRKDGNAVMALADGFYFFDFDSGKCELIHDPEPDMADTRLNDGKVDKRGRFIAGSMDMTEQAAAGSLYRLDPDLTCHKLNDQIMVSLQLLDIVPFLEEKLNEAFVEDVSL